MVITLQPFSIQFTRFFETPQKKTLETTFYLNVTKTKTLLEDTKIELPSKRERENVRFNWTRHDLVYSHIKYT